VTLPPEKAVGVKVRLPWKKIFIRREYDNRQQ
jgi:hypothetical protein